MRRHSLDPESIRKQIRAVFSSSRKRQESSSTHLGFNLSRRMRRFSVPEKHQRAEELHTIDEVRRKDATPA